MSKSNRKKNIFVSRNGQTSVFWHIVVALASYECAILFLPVDILLVLNVCNCSITCDIMRLI